MRGKKEDDNNTGWGGGGERGGGGGGVSGSIREARNFFRKPIHFDQYKSFFISGLITDLFSSTF